MLPRISLLDELRKGGYEASLITTFNAYPPFYEEVVLRRLVGAGVRHNVLMMDARQYGHSLEHYPPRLAGREYILLPVKVAGTFHPKLMFLVGKRKGLIVVGSHNMTLAGFGFNRELTNLARIEGADDRDGVALAHEVWDEVEHWLINFSEGVPDHVKRMVRRVRDFAPWLSAEGGAGDVLRLLVGRPGGRTLWEQLTDLLDSEATHVSLCGAFFDQELRFLKRIKHDLKPRWFTVAVDPDTVKIPPQARTMADISIVGANGLGLEDGKEEGSSRYLHAKGILVEQANGGTVFASGSANPSAPAWLSSDSSANVELMLAYTGQRARAIAADMGFTRIVEMPVLGEADWTTIASNTEQCGDPIRPRYRSGIAVVEDTCVIIRQALLEGLGNPEFLLCSPNGKVLDRSSRLRVDSDAGIIEFPEAKLTDASVVDVVISGELVLKLLLHHVRAIEDQARSGTQRRFKEALLSLDTDTPNIELLIHCVDKIIASESRDTPSPGLKKTGTRGQAPSEEQEPPATLAIDISEVKHHKSKKRLIHSSDFSYLLDALIYHLRIAEDKSIEELDHAGRNEEEQVGADDDQDADSEQPTAQKQKVILDVCHARVGTVISRMVAQLNAYAKGKQTLRDLLVRLLAVLAVLRELRSCDGRVSWVEKGQTTVPMKQRHRLLEEIMLNLFEGESSLLQLEALGDDFQHSDDMARLKGLVLWLAWDCGLTMELNKPFMESRNQLDERLKRNAMILALAQMIQSDDVVIDEARQSIGSLTSSEMDWLKEVQRLAFQCEILRHDHSSLFPADSAEPGDIALHKKKDDWILRVVSGSGGNRVFLVRLSRDRERIEYRSEYLGVTRL